MGQIKNDIHGLFPGLDMNQFSLLPLLENFFEGIIVTDEYGRVLFVNEEQERIDDMPARALLGKKVTDIYRVDDGDSPSMQCIKTGSPVKGLACYYRTCTGKVVNSIHNVFPLFEGRQLIGTICFIQDFSIIEQRFGAVNQKPLIPGEKKLQLANGTQFRFQDIIGESRQFLECIETAKMAARSVSPVMLFGETGTGKELIAQSIHNSSSRSQNPYVAINCAAIPENLLEGIMFGTAKGAFTGAVDKQGLFERAHGGTLFLDEINSMTVGLQAKLLRFLQERKVRRVGSLAEVSVDLKIISSVNQNPHLSIANGSLRSDLFYRLAVVFILIPPLRERREDLLLLIPHFLKKIGLMLSKKVTAVSGDVMALFDQYTWPGNVRELEHIIEGGMNIVSSNTIMDHHLPSHLALFSKDRPTGGKSFSDKGEAGSSPFYFPLSPAGDEKSARVTDRPSLAETRKNNELRMITEALTRTSGKPSAAARFLGISPQLLNYKMKKYRLSRLDYLS
jgi:arginine utilization regulatory protein